MERKIKFIILVLLSGLFFSANKAEAAISITVTGSWSETIDELHLQAGAGSDLIDTYESASDVVSIDISGTTGAEDDWRVDVKRVDTSWHNSFVLYVKRTSEGTGAGSISGGDSYQEVTDTYQSLFSGSGDRSGIHIQLKLSGVSIHISQDNHTTTVYYTVVDN